MLCAVAQAQQSEKIVPVKQGWSEEDKKQWYSLSQGSRLIPLDWLRALKQPGTDGKPFLDPANVEKYRYLINQYSKDGLPVGFAIDEQRDSLFGVTQMVWKHRQSSKEKWVGMNCSACHTQEITYNNSRLRIEGAPTLADFRGFMKSLTDALGETLNQRNKFDRFVADMRGNGHDIDEPKLKVSLRTLVTWLKEADQANFPGTVAAYGFARLDAFGHIFNKVSLGVTMLGMTQKTNASDAPVSYPFLWNIPQYDKVQWNGIAKKVMLGTALDVGALGRNVGEVTGVFADINWELRETASGVQSVFNSSADVGNLIKLERQLSRLSPPLWSTSTFGRIDDPKRDRGREVFIDEKRTRPDGSLIPSCNSCHKSLRRDGNELKRRLNAEMAPLKEIGTDLWMACNAVMYQARVGHLSRNGQSRDEVVPLAQLTAAITIGTLTDARNLLKIGASAATVRAKVDESFEKPTRKGGAKRKPLPAAVLSPDQPERSDERQKIYNACLDTPNELLAYKARLLTGIWSTGPFLHNGSVPTLYDLLLPPDKRPKSFPIGTREFDIVRVGFVTREPGCTIPEKAPEGTSPFASRDTCKIAAPSGANSFEFKTRDVSGKIIDGNSNDGHDYGNEWMSDDDRWALVEYMKGL
jgi:hypothetical protein